MPIWIRALGNYCEPVDDQLPPLKPLVRETIGVTVRRVGRFIQLALVGAGRCVGDLKPPPDTGVYFGSASGDLEITVQVLEMLFKDGQDPNPLNFVNTVSNAPNFYVAKHFGLAGRSNFVCSRYAGFESALELAALDMEAGHLQSALVGSVDIATMPLADHRMRLSVPETTVMAEGSHWLWLTGGRLPSADTVPSQAMDAPTDALAELIAARRFVDRDDCAAWIQSRLSDAGDCRIARGQFIDAASFEAIMSDVGVDRELTRTPAPGYYEGQSGAAISEFLRQAGGEELLHINGEPDTDRISLLWVRRANALRKCAAT